MKKFTSLKSNKIKYSLVAFLLVGGSIGLLANKYFNTINNGNISEIEIEENGISLKFLSTKENEDGSISKTFSYEVKPEYATDKTITCTLKFVDNSDCSSYMKAQINNGEQTITLTNMKAFDQQIIVTLISNADKSKTASLTCDYEKKLLSIEDRDKNNKHYTIGNGWTNAYGETGINDFKIENFIIPNYSVFTKDKNYTFSYSKFNLQFDELCGITNNNDLFNEITVELKDALYNKVENQEGYLSKEEVWNLIDSNEWRSALKETSNNNPDDDYYVSYEIIGTVVCNENPKITLELDTLFYCSLKYDYSEKVVGVDSIKLDTDNIIF